MKLWTSCEIHSASSQLLSTNFWLFPATYNSQNKPKIYFTNDARSQVCSFIFIYRVCSFYSFTATTSGILIAVIATTMPKKSNQTNEAQKFCLSIALLVWFCLCLPIGFIYFWANVVQSNAEKGTSTSFWLVLVCYMLLLLLLFFFSHNNLPLVSLFGPEFQVGVCQFGSVFAVIAIMLMLFAVLLLLLLLLLPLLMCCCELPLCHCCCCCYCMFYRKCVAMQIIFFVSL